MSSFSDDFAASAGAAMLSYQGDSVTRYASGGSSSTVTAIVSDEDGGGMEVVTDAGVRRIRMKTLQVAASQTLDIDDQWAIGGYRWSTVAMTDAHDGLRVVTVQRVERTKNEKSPARGG